MSRSLLRRLDDAFCAFRTGHSRRDLDRVRVRRLTLLGRRWVERQERIAAENEFFQEYFRGSAQSSRDLFEKYAQSRGRVGSAALLQSLEVERLCLRSRRIGLWAQVGSLDGPDEYTLQQLKAAPVFSDEFYGKLYEGLREEFVLDPLQNKLRCGIRHGRRFLRAVKVRWLFCIHGKLPVGELSKGRYRPEPQFGMALDYQTAGDRRHG